MTLIFKQDRAPPVLIETLENMGWREFDEKEDGEDDWNLLWKPTRYANLSSL
jgi:hypothetical protein